MRWIVCHFKVNSKYGFDVCYLKKLLGNELSRNLLFVRAFRGCDSTSRIYEIGKKVLFEKLLKNYSIMKSCTGEFAKCNQVQSIIINSGINVFISLYGGKPDLSLTQLRSNFLVKKISSAKSYVKPEKLPPTISAAKFHSKLVYYQIMLWMGKDDKMNPIDWG